MLNIFIYSFNNQIKIFMSQHGISNQPANRILYLFNVIKYSVFVDTYLYRNDLCCQIFILNLKLL